MQLNEKQSKRMKNTKSFELLVGKIIREGLIQLEGDELQTKDLFRCALIDFERSRHFSYINNELAYNSNDEEDENSQKTFFNKLDVSNNFRDSIIINHFQGGATTFHFGEFVTLPLQLLPESYIGSHSIALNDRQRRFNFTQITKERVRAESEFTYNKFRGPFCQEKLEDYITLKTEFDFVWNNKDKKISIENVKVELIPLGEFKSFIPGYHLDKLYNKRFLIADAVVAASAFLALACIASFAVLNARLDPNILKYTPPFILIFATLFTTFFFAAMGYRYFQKDKYKRSLKEMNDGEIPEEISEEINKMQCDDIFDAFKAYLRERVINPTLEGVEPSEKKAEKVSYLNNARIALKSLFGNVSPVEVIHEQPQR